MTSAFENETIDLCLTKPASKLSYLDKRSEPRENARATRLRRSLALSRETLFTRPNRGAYWQAILFVLVLSAHARTCVLCLGVTFGCVCVVSDPNNYR